MTAHASDLREPAKPPTPEPAPPALEPPTPEPAPPTAEALMADSIASHAADGSFERAVGTAPAGGRWVAALRDVILGGQDGLVNVLGLVLGMAAATGDTRVIVTAGLAAMMAESIAMAGVAFTATGAEGVWARQQSAHLLDRMHDRSLADARARRAALGAAGWPDDHVAEVERLIDEERAAWSRDVVAMHEELAPVRETRPATAALTVGIATLAGSSVPLTPFLLLPVPAAAPIAMLLGGIVLAIAGVFRARAVGSNPVRASAEMVLIGLLSALAGYLIGLALRVPATA